MNRGHPARHPPWATRAVSARPKVPSARIYDPAVRPTEGLRIPAPCSARVSDPAVRPTEGLRIPAVRLAATRPSTCAGRLGLPE